MSMDVSSRTQQSYSPMTKEEAYNELGKLKKDNIINGYQYADIASKISKSKNPSETLQVELKNKTQTLESSPPSVSQTAHKVSMFAIRILQIKEFAKLIIKKGEIFLQSMGKSTSKIKTSDCLEQNEVFLKIQGRLTKLQTTIDTFSTTTKSGQKLEDVMDGEVIKNLSNGESVTETKQRESFIDFLKDNVANKKYERVGTIPDPKTITMKELLGEEGVKKYIDAIKEEKESFAFKKAVFAQSIKTYEGPSWGDEPHVLYIGAPSASGKTFAAAASMEKISEKEAKNTPSEKKGNVAVNIDGGIEREVSKMRSELLRIALEKGFDGIEDLQEKTDDKKAGPKIKRQIKAIAIEKKLNMVIPNTFVSNLPGDIKEMEDLHNKGFKLHFVEVAGKNPKEFKETVFRQGESRAWKEKEDGKLPESKRYEGEVFDAGMAFSKKAMEAYQKITGQDGLRLISDRIYVKIGKEGKLERATAEDPTSSVVGMSERQFEAFNRAPQPLASNIKDLNDWATKTSKDLAPPIFEAVEDLSKKISEKIRNEQQIEQGRRGFFGRLFG